MFNSQILAGPSFTSIEERTIASFETGSYYSSFPVLTFDINVKLLLIKLKFTSH